MKKKTNNYSIISLFLIIFLVFGLVFSPIVNAAYTTFNCDALTGGAGRALDSHAVGGLTTGDRAICSISGELLYFVYDSTATAAENVATHPYVVRPDDYSTGGNWEEQVWGGGMDTLSLTAAAELTISGGAITKTQSLHGIDAEADAASDDLDTISGSSDGDIIIVKAEHTDRTVVLKDGTGNLELNGADITIDDTDLMVILVYDATLAKWILAGGGGGAGDVTAAANIDANAVVIGDDAAKGIKKATLLVSDAGEMTNPSQPCFQAVPTADQNDIAVTTVVTVVLGTERFDQGNDFASNTFTAPVSGNYYLGGNLNLQTVDSAATYYSVRLITSNKTYYYNLPSDGAANDVNQWSLPFSLVVDMDANDTAYIAAYQQGGVQQTDITAQDTVFSGFLAN